MKALNAPFFVIRSESAPVQAVIFGPTLRRGDMRITMALPTAFRDCLENHTVSSVNDGFHQTNGILGHYDRTSTRNLAPLTPSVIGRSTSLFPSMTQHSRICSGENSNRLKLIYCGMKSGCLSVYCLPSCQLLKRSEIVHSNSIIQLIDLGLSEHLNASRTPKWKLMSQSRDGTVVMWTLSSVDWDILPTHVFQVGSTSFCKLAILSCHHLICTPSQQSSRLVLYNYESDLFGIDGIQNAKDVVSKHSKLPSRFHNKSQELFGDVSANGVCMSIKAIRIELEDIRCSGRLDMEINTRSIVGIIALFEGGEIWVWELTKYHKHLIDGLSDVEANDLNKNETALRYILAARIERNNAPAIDGIFDKMSDFENIGNFKLHDQTFLCKDVICAIKVDHSLCYLGKDDPISIVRTEGHNSGTGSNQCLIDLQTYGLRVLDILHEYMESLRGILSHGQSNSNIELRDEMIFNIRKRVGHVRHQVHAINSFVNTSCLFPDDSVGSITASNDLIGLMNDRILQVNSIIFQMIEQHHLDELKNAEQIETISVEGHNVSHPSQSHLKLFDCSSLPSMSFMTFAICGGSGNKINIVGIDWMTRSMCTLETVTLEEEGIQDIKIDKAGRYVAICTWRGRVLMFKLLKHILEWKVDSWLNSSMIQSPSEDWKNVPALHEVICWSDQSRSIQSLDIWDQNEDVTFNTDPICKEHWLVSSSMDGRIVIHRTCQQQA